MLLQNRIIRDEVSVPMKVYLSIIYNITHSKVKNAINNFVLTPYFLLSTPMAPLSTKTLASWIPPFARSTFDVIHPHCTLLQLISRNSA